MPQEAVASRCFRDLGSQAVVAGAGTSSFLPEKLVVPTLAALISDPGHRRAVRADQSKSGLDQAVTVVKAAKFSSQQVLPLLLLAVICLCRAVAETSLADPYLSFRALDPFLDHQAMFLC